MNALSWLARTAVVAWTVFAPSQATAQFPDELMAEIAAGTATIPTLLREEANFTVYAYAESGVNRLLIEYRIGVASVESTEATTTPLTGPVWMGFGGVISLVEPRHEVRLYLDAVVPEPTNIWAFDSDGLDVRLSLTTADLLAGSASMTFSDPGGLQGDLQTIGDGGSIWGQSLVPCLAQGCAVGAKANLLYVRYEPAGAEAILTIDPTDPRTLLYSQWRSYSPDPGNWNLSQTYDASPEPSAATLAGVAVIASLCLRRRSRCGD